MWDLKVPVNMKVQGGETVELTDILYIPRAVKNILIVLRLVSKGATMWPTKDKMTINKNSFNMIMDARKGKNEITIFYLKDKIYAPEVSSNQE